MTPIIIISPTSVVIPKKTKKDQKIYLNLNTYRNLHFLVNNKAKVLYKHSMKPQLDDIRIDEPVDITYQVVKGTRRKLDKMNVVSIVSKFLLDAMTELNCWDDDNDEIVKTETIKPTLYRKGENYCIVTIKSHEGSTI